MELSETALVLLGLLLAAWTIAAAWAILAARAQVRQTKSARRTARRLARMIEDSPAVPMLVRVDGKIEGSERLAAWLGLDAVPAFLSELDSGTGGLTVSDLDELQQAVKRTQKTAAPFQMAVTPRGSTKRLAVRGQHADPEISAAGAALVWFISEDEGELVRLRAEAERARGDAAALAGMIEAAPIPMWLRGADGRLQLVNSAYLEAVDADSAEQVLSDQIELQDGERRFRVGVVPLGEEGTAGYGIDVGEMERQARALQGYREAQRSIFERLSTGVAHFDADRVLAFANRPFHRIFGLPSAAQGDSLDFDRFLDIAHEAGRLPRVRDFSAWRSRLGEWFTANGASEDIWPLSDGMQVRLVGQPMPDGGLALFVEERPRQPAASLSRDPLRRSAILDHLFESLAVFAPDGKLLLWNRRFPKIWGLPEQLAKEHPQLDFLLDSIAPKLAGQTEREAIGEVVQGAMQQRRRRSGRVTLADGRTLQIAGSPLPDGSVLLALLEADEPKKIDGGEAPQEVAPAPEQAEIELMPFIVDIVSQREEAIEARRLTLDLRGDRSAGRIRGDKEQIGSAIGDFIDHAITAAPEGGRVLVTLPRRRSRARIVISHEGEAIEPGEAARQVIEAHGGRIEAGHQKGGGSSLTISLP